MTPGPAASDDRSTPLWYALRTRGRAERQAALRLAGAGVEVFPALAPIRRTWSDRVKRVEMPLFPGYIFARFALVDAAHALAVPGVVEVVRTGGRATPLREAELDAVRRLAAGVEATGELPEPSDSLADLLEPGVPVRVVEGPFAGLLGTFVKREGGHRVAVEIRVLRQTRAVRMERSMVAPLHPQGMVARA
jgi:transcription antitermination factor NusG